MRIRSVSLAIALAIGSVAAYAQNPYGGQFLKVAYSNQTNRALIRDVQRMLAELGYDPGPADGAMGERTRNAIRKYQGHSGFAKDGRPSESLRAALAADLGYPSGSTGSSGSAGSSSPVSTPTAPAAPPAQKPAAGSGEPRYSSNYGKPPANAELDRLVARLSTLIDSAERQSAADPNFLKDLRAELKRATTKVSPTPAPAPPVPPAPVTPPSRRAVLEDNFADGDFTRNPKWRIATGDFFLDRYGMRSQVQKTTQARSKQTKKNEVPLAVLGALLGSKSGSDSSVTSANPAEIYVETAFPAALVVKARIVQLSETGRIEFGMFQENSLGTGLRAQLKAGQNAELALYRFQSGRGNLRADSRGARLSTYRGRTYEFEWRRSSNGRTEIRIDGRSVLNGQDKAGSRGFEGFVLRNDVGDFALKSLVVERP